MLTFRSCQYIPRYIVRMYYKAVCCSCFFVYISACTLCNKKRIENNVLELCTFLFCFSLRFAFRCFSHDSRSKFAKVLVNEFPALELHWVENVAFMSRCMSHWEATEVGKASLLIGKVSWPWDKTASRLSMTTGDANQINRQHPPQDYIMYRSMLGFATILLKQQSMNVQHSQESAFMIMLDRASCFSRHLAIHDEPIEDEDVSAIRRKLADDTWKQRRSLSRLIDSIIVICVHGKRFDQLYGRFWLCW